VRRDAATLLHGDGGSVRLTVSKYAMAASWRIPHMATIAASY
jgi:hypothetical protein